MKIEVNRTFLPIKALYLLYLSGVACLNPYLPVYMIVLGLSTSQIGLIRGLEPAVLLIVSPLCGLLSDKYSCHKIVLIISLSGSAIFYFLTIFAPSVPVSYANVTNADNISFQHLCNEEFYKQLTNESYSVNNNTTFNKTILMSSSQCSCEKLEDKQFLEYQNESTLTNTSFLTKNVLCNNFTDHDCKNNCSCVCCKLEPNFTNTICNDDTTSTLSYGSSTLTFVIMLILILTGQVFMCNIFPLVDMAVIELLQDNRGDYGKQRLWGAVGWGTFSLVMGFILDQNHTSNIKAKYLPAHLSFIVFLFGAVIATIKMKFPPHRRPTSCFKNICNVLCQAEVLIFLFVVIIMGMCLGITSTFLFIYIAELHGNHFLMGLTLVTTCVSEIPFLYFSGRLIDCLGHQNVIYLTLVCYSLRFLGYSLVRNAWLILIVEPLHGVTFGAFWTAMRVYAGIISPPGMAATLQSFVSTVDVGIGRGIGTIVGGLIYQHYGGRFLFRCCTIMCLITAVLYCLSRQIIIRTCPITDYRLFQDEEDTPVEQQLEEIPQSPESLPVKLKSRKSMRLVLHSINKPADCPLNDDDSNMARIMQGVPPVLPSHGPSGASVCIQTSSRGQSTASSSCSSFVERWPHLPNLGEDEEEFQSKSSVVNVESYMPSPNALPYDIVMKEHTV